MLRRIRTHRLIATLPIAAAAVLLPASTELAQLGVPSTPAATLRLPHMFADGMVVQREKPVAVWGWADAGAEIDVEFRGHTARARVAASGTWRASLPAERAGGPFELTVRTGDARVVIRDVLVGDLWIASGQSNMEFTVAQANDAAREVAAANDPRIRQFKVPTSWADRPADDLAGGSWVPADSRHVGAFSAVGYFFARELRKSVDVPIGIINTTWGGSNIESWMSADAQRLTDSAFAAIVRAEDSRTAALRDSLRARLGDLPNVDAGLMNGVARWADPALDDGDWTTMRVPAYWEPNGYTGMDGVAWYRLAVDLAENDVRGGITVSFTAIDDDDITWMNGVELGRTTGYNVSRAYRVPVSALRVGRNVLTVRVADGGGGGGINGAASLTLADGRQRSLAGVWKFKVGQVSFQADGQRINKIPTRLYNKMLSPLLPLSIKGVIWYQGESNANNMEQASAYRWQFASLIESWRRGFGSGRENFPFLWVQLPNFGAADSVPPTQAAWATQRESMSAALALSTTGQAIVIDVGDPADIHPRNKQDVGARLGRVARTVAYGESIVASGPTYRSHVVRGDTVIVEFDNVAGGLVSRSEDGRVGGFALGGADGRFVWASARIVGDRVHVWSDRVARPAAVRYAWANNPAGANLYNREQLPAAPFRTDR